MKRSYVFKEEYMKKNISIMLSNEKIRRSIVQEVDGDYFNVSCDSKKAIQSEIIILGDDEKYETLEYMCNYYIKDCGKKVVIVSIKSDFDIIVSMIAWGISDYVFYPFKKEELNNRLKVVGAFDSNLSVNGVTLSNKEHVLFTKDKKIILSDREYIILYNLMKNSNRVISRERLFNLISDFDSDAEYRIVTEYIYGLRKKLKKIKCDNIETIYGNGYKWNVSTV